MARTREIDLVLLAQSGDRGATQELVDAHIRLVYKVARRYRCRTYSLDDLVQEGVVGLLHAIQRFDTTRGFRLSTYAMHWIRQAIARAVEQNDRIIHVPMHASAEIRQIAQARDAFQQSRGRTPSDAELAEITGLDEERVSQLAAAMTDAVSLEAMVGHEQDHSLLDSAEDPMALDPEQDAVLGVYRAHLHSLMDTLRPREREIIEQRFGINGRQPRTLDDLSREMRVSRERVRQIEVQAMRKLRYALSRGQWE